ncbi:E3 ubiquitin-protein ligase RSL1-like [Andrographis paniculata]|uniref:E3 ubiquitin-protein ligase RSL1-like n=1 Tax=Andrographis paniculata TaxID=175694 RepID=UPI0021E89CA5|nr:E3 ubiquitin-protein ligase RSL1-like [Andrographis paniculata]
MANEGSERWELPVYIAADWSAARRMPIHRVSTVSGPPIDRLNFVQARREKVRVSYDGESSKSNMFTCEICAEEMPVSSLFRIQGCNHSYCTNCIGSYVVIKLDSNVTAISCPEIGCAGVLKPHHCQSILPKQVFDRWCDALCEALIPSPEKFYCPFKDCSALLMNDADRNGEIVVESECPVCNKLFCAQCKVPWHSEMTCEAFRRWKSASGESNNADVMVTNLAEREKWMRCSNCEFFVEKSEGCSHVKCRCGHNFCYDCGSSLVNSYCSKCRG